MLQFYSASTRQVDSARAMAQCLQSAAAVGRVSLVIFHAGMGHDFAVLAAEAGRLCPGAQVLGASCCGIVGREGVSETLKDLAVMVITGEECDMAFVDGIHGHNSHVKALELAKTLRRRLPNPRQVFWLSSGIDIANDECLRALHQELGPEVTVFGATSSDNMRGVISLQSVNGTLMEHGAWAIAFGDKTLEVDTQASHGFVAMGKPLRVTRCEGNRILELNGRPAWMEYTQRLGLDPERATCADSIPIGALAEALAPELAAEYGNDHLLRVVTRHGPGGDMLYPVNLVEGTELWLTVRDEERIFADLRRMMRQMLERLGGREIVAVFHSDCLARGRHLLDRIAKEELVGIMQGPLSQGGGIPPWLGMYGFGEFARLGGVNTFHNYTTAIACLSRCPA